MILLKWEGHQWLGAIEQWLALVFFYFFMGRITVFGRKTHGLRWWPVEGWANV